MFSADAEFVEHCAKDRLAMFVDCCSPERAASLICSAVTKLDQATLFVIVADDDSYAHVLRASKKALRDREWQQEILICDARRVFGGDGNLNVHSGTLLLFDAATLREIAKVGSLRLNHAGAYFCPIVVIIDPRLSLFETRAKVDPAWIVRDLCARLCVSQDGVALVVFTEREAVSIATERVRQALAVDGLLYMDPRVQSNE